MRVRRKRKAKEDNVEQDLSHVPDDTQSFVKSVVDGLSIGDGEFLIAVVWITERGCPCHSLYTFAKGYDVKYRTNSEKRPLTQ